MAKNRDNERAQGKGRFSTRSERDPREEKAGGMQPGTGADEVAARKAEMDAMMQQRQAEESAQIEKEVTQSRPPEGAEKSGEPMQRPEKVSEAERGWPQSGMGLAEALPEDEYPGRVGPIGREEIAEADRLLQKYKAAKTMLEARAVENEEFFKMRHWESIDAAKRRNPTDPEPASAWLLNCLINKHADAMDNFPAPNVLPREKSDEEAAKSLSAVLPAVLEECQYEELYSDAWWDKLKLGTSIKGIFWEPSKQNGLGDVDIRLIDVLNIFWEPGVTDIQKSRNVFHVDLMDREEAMERYPFLKDAMRSGSFDLTKYRYDDTVDVTDKVLLVDWYYKRRNPGGQTVLHYCKYCAGELIYASENDEAYAERGYYDHGRYPFVFDSLFPVKGTPVSFGYLDICKHPQLYIDKLDQGILKHAVLNGRPRYFMRKDSGINEREFADLQKDIVHYEGAGNPNDAIMPITPPAMDGSVTNVKQLKIDELKEVSGNRDFQQGSTASGVTAASAISALQEAGSKGARDMIKASYRSFVQECYLVIELMRQFYTEERYFRVAGEEGDEYVSFSNAQIAPQQTEQPFGGGVSERLPVFDIKVSPQKSSPFSTVAQNERAKDLYSMGFFRPDMADQALAALEMMQFDDIDKVRRTIRQNGTMYQQMQQMMQLAMAMAQQLDAMEGGVNQYALQVQQVVQQVSGGLASTPSGGGDDNAMRVDALGAAYNMSKNQTAAAARNEAASQSTPRA